MVIKTMEKNQKITNIALVGCGGMARSYRHKYTKIPGAALVLVIDVSEETAKSAGEALNVRWSTNFNDCLAPDIDIVDISTPNQFHREQAVAAMRAGKHVLVQKPLANNVENAEAIVDAAKETGVFAGMYMSMFDNPIVYEIKELIDAGALGEVTGFNIRNAHTGGLHAAPGAWRSSLEQTGGGSFIQLAVHNMNLVQWLIGQKITSVSSFSKNIMSPNIGGDDLTAVACETDKGILGTMSSAYNAERNEMSIYGTKGFITLIDSNLLTLKLTIAHNSKIFEYNTPNETKVIELKGGDESSLYGNENSCSQHIAFVKAVMAGKQPQSSVEVGLYDMRIIKAIYKSAIEKRAVDVL